MPNNYYNTFKEDYKFLEEYGFVFTNLPYNKNRMCYRNRYGCISKYEKQIDTNYYISVIFVELNGHKVEINVCKEYEKYISKFSLHKPVNEMFKELLDYMIINNSNNFYGLIISNIDNKLTKKYRYNTKKEIRKLKNKEKPKKIKMSKEEKLEILKIAIISLLGLGLSILFIYFYNVKNNTFLTVVTGLISFIYMQIGIYILFKSSDGLNNPFKSLFLFPLIYIVIVFLILLFLCQNGIKEDVKVILDCLLWTIYSMSSFIIIISIICLLLILSGG